VGSLRVADHGLTKIPRNDHRSRDQPAWNQLFPPKPRAREASYLLDSPTTIRGDDPKPLGSSINDVSPLESGASLWIDP
jgi:hypothetical protein